MKARTKAARIRARKGGRPRKGGARTPSGRLSRAGEKDDVMATAIGARCRQHGIDAKDARDPRWGTAIGRLAIAETITPAAYATVIRFLRIRADAHRAMQAPGQPKIARTGSSGDSSTEAYAEWCAGAIKRYEDILDAVAELPALIVQGDRFHSPLTALSTVIVDDQYQDWMLPQLQAVIRAMQAHFSAEKTGEMAA